MRLISNCAFLALILALQYDRIVGFVSSSSCIFFQRQQQSSPKFFTFLENSPDGDNEDAEKSVIPSTEEVEEKKSLIPDNSLVLTTAFLGFVAVATQAGAYSDFFNSLSQMKANMAVDPTDFWPAVNFWVFFAAGHAILQPIFWISEVLHASPGPMVGDLVPISFIVGNIVAIAAFIFIKEVRFQLGKNCVNSFLSPPCDLVNIF